MLKSILSNYKSRVETSKLNKELKDGILEELLNILKQIYDSKNYAEGDFDTKKVELLKSINAFHVKFNKRLSERTYHNLELVLSTLVAEYYNKYLESYLSKPLDKVDNFKEICDVLNKTLKQEKADAITEEKLSVSIGKAYSYQNFIEKTLSKEEDVSEFGKAINQLLGSKNVLAFAKQAKVISDSSKNVPKHKM